MTSFIEERQAAYAGVTTRELAVSGSGPTIILVHGFADSADAWRQVLDLLADAGQAAIAVDLPGFGKADPLDVGELVPQLDAFLAAVIRHHGGREGVVVVGNSLGGAVAARAARNKELPVVGVMPLDIAGITWQPIAKGTSPLAAVTKLVSNARVPKRLHRAAIERILARLLYGERSAVDPRIVAAFAATFVDLHTTISFIGRGAQFKTELDRNDDHGGIDVPMIVVHGAKDRLVPVSASRILHEANPGSRLVVLERVGHCPQLDAPHVIVRRARELANFSTESKEIS